jgi:hypothetical protein
MAPGHENDSSKENAMLTAIPKVRKYLITGLLEKDCSLERKVLDTSLILRNSLLPLITYSNCN